MTDSMRFENYGRENMTHIPFFCRFGGSIQAVVRSTVCRLEPNIMLLLISLIIFNKVHIHIMGIKHSASYVIYILVDGIATINLWFPV
jgi:hypothetical protein